MFCIQKRFSVKNVLIITEKKRKTVLKETESRERKF